MSKSHKGSRLTLKNQIIPVKFNTAHFSFQEDVVGIQYGELVSPIGTSIYSLDNNGIFGKCILINDGGRLTYPITLNNDFTISCWVNASNIVANQFVLDTRTASLNGLGIQDKSDGKIRFYTSDGTTLTYLDSTTFVLDGQWHHIVITLSSLFEKKIYIDGLLEGTQTVSSVVLGSLMNIGSNYSYAEQVNGLISDLRIDNEVVMGDEIRAWFESQSPYYNPYDYRSYAY